MSHLDNFEEEIETIKSLYPDQVTISDNGTIICVIEIDNKYIIQAKFITSKQSINISVSNNEKCIERYSKKVLHKIQSKLDEICQEESDSMPIYQCISYLNDSLIDEMLINYSTNENTNKAKDNQELKNDNDISNDNDYDYNFIGKNNKKKRKKKDNDSKNESNLPIITIYTWGNKCRKHAPIQSQHNTNVCGVTGYKPRGINLKQLNGKDEQIQKYVENGKNYYTYLNNLKNKIINEGLNIISINCHKGRHRSVAFAELFAKDLRKNHGYKVNVIHLEIS